MKIGIIGLANSGKTTVFNALTGSNVLTSSYTSAAGEHHLGQVQVPDPRLDFLFRLYEPKKKVPAVIEFVDVAGIAKGSGRSGGIAEEMLHFIRDVDALIHVVRAFEDTSVPHPQETVDPARDMRTMDTELILNDLVAVEKRRERLEKEMARLPKEKRQPLAAEREVLDRFYAHLEAEHPLRTLAVSPEEMKLVKGYAFLSLQPMLVLLNIGEGQIREAMEIAEHHRPGPGIPVLAVCGKVEAEISQLSEADAALFMADLGISQTGRDRVIREAYGLLGLHSFFTVGKDEVRAWTIRKGDNALAAAGRIHTDLARGFIRAEVVAYDDLEAAGSWAKAKEMGKYRLEGKEYLVKDGDVLVIRFNV